MRRILAYCINGIFVMVVILMAVAISTIALTRKVNRYRAQYQHGLHVTVIKKEVPILAYSRGIVKKVNVKVGQEVKKNTILAQLDNPSLRGKIDVLGAYSQNVSAQTEARVAAEELKQLVIASPVDGIIADLHTTEGAPVEALSKCATVYANSDTKLLAQLTVEQYQMIKRLPEIRAYSPRLNQTFVVKPSMLSPAEKNQEDLSEKKIGLYFRLANEQDSSSLLHNEDLDILVSSSGPTVKKPIDYFVDFWNGLLQISPTRDNFET